MISAESLASRQKRLETLVMGLAREAMVIRAGDDPLLFAERNAYMKAVFNAIDGLDAARVVLATATQRMVKKAT